MDFEPGRDDWRRDIPFLLVAAVLHGALFAGNPTWRWGASLGRTAEQLIPVEFVAAPARAELAVPPPSQADKDQPAAVPAPAAEAAKPKPKTKPKAVAALKRTSAKRLARQQGQEARAKALAERKAASALRRQQALAYSKSLTAQRDARARKQEDISRALAQLVDPDEKLSDALNSPDAPAAAAEAALAAPEAAAQDEPAERPLAGSGDSWSLEGPAGARRIVSRVLPESPDWVSQRGLELSVQVRFSVLADGAVASGVVVKKTSGFPEIDRRAVEAIRRWRFEKAPAAAGAPAAWGSVRFKFTTG